MATGKTYGDEIFPLPKPILGDGDFLLLLVDIRDSAACPGIETGDWVIIRKQQVVADGGLVAVMINGDAVVRQFGPFEDYDSIIGKVTHVLHQVST